MECFTTTFLHAHSWLNWVDEDDGEDEVGLKEKPEDTRYSTNHVYLHRFSILRLHLKRKTHPAFRVLNVFYFQTDFNLRFKRKRDVHLTCQRV